MSTNKQIICGVPQGSILGPILFLIYINDIYRCSAKLQFILFADDTTIVDVGNDWSEVSTVVNQELGILSNWFNVNQLSLNLAKTNYIAFNRSSPSRNLNICMDGKAVQQVLVTKFLGIEIVSHHKSLTKNFLSSFRF